MAVFCGPVLDAYGRVVSSYPKWHLFHRVTLALQKPMATWLLGHVPEAKTDFQSLENAVMRLQEMPQIHVEPEERVFKGTCATPGIFGGAHFPGACRWLLPWKPTGNAVDWGLTHRKSPPDLHNFYSL